MKEIIGLSVVVIELVLAILAVIGVRKLKIKLLIERMKEDEETHRHNI